MNLKNKIELSELKARKESIQKIFFYRICGTGMGAAACLLKEKGYDVQGADLKFYPPMGDYLKHTGIPLYKAEEITPEFLKGFDLIVVGNVVSGKSPEARMLEEIGVPFVSFPSAIGALVLNDVNVVGIAGTHGKTTTTYFFTQLFEKLGTNPGYFIGGVIEGRNSSRLGDGKYFFIESDEYDSAYFEKISKFRLYCIDHLILTSLEFDHADIFKNVQEIKDQFKFALPEIKKSILVSSDYPAIKELQLESKDTASVKDWRFYGEQSLLGPKIIKCDPSQTEFSLQIAGKTEIFKTNVVGPHNILNLSAAVLFAAAEGFALDSIRKSLMSLQMVKRRQEVRGKYRGTTVIDDFAHHPRAVQETIRAINLLYPNLKVCVVIEPNSATARSSIFQKEFGECFLGAAEVIWARPEKATTVEGQQNLDCIELSHRLKKSGISSVAVSNLVDLREQIDLHTGDKNVLLILSNGTCLGLWESDFVREIH